MFMKRITTPDGRGYLLGTNNDEVFVTFSRNEFSQEIWLEKFSKYNSPSVTKVYKIQDICEEKEKGE